MTIGHVVIVGGGFSGALLAVNLLRHDGPRATLIERGAMAGEGLAYGAAHASHILNVRAASMSAFADGVALGPPVSERPRQTGSALLRAVRARATEIGWRKAVDELRPFTQAVWRGASPAERGRFLRHLRPWWDVHRHRLAPQVADRLATMIAQGRLTVVAGRPVRTEEVSEGLTVYWRRRGRSDVERLTVDRVVNCTGPQGDFLRTGDPLLRALLDRNAIRPDACCIGIDVDLQSRTLSASGTENDWLLALGPMTRGAFWEIVAVPDIRAQVWTLARRLSHAHWVSGDGL